MISSIGDDWVATDVLTMHVWKKQCMRSSSQITAMVWLVYDICTHKIEHDGTIVHIAIHYIDTHAMCTVIYNLYIQ